MVFNSIILLLTFSHLRTVFSDPGIVPLPQSKLDFAELHTGLLSEFGKLLSNICVVVVVLVSKFKVSLLNII